MGADQGDDDDDDVDRFYRCLSMSRDVDRRRYMYSIGGADGRMSRATTTTTTSIDFIDVSPCLATSIDIDTCRRSHRRATTTTSIDYITALDMCEACTEAVHSLALLNTGYTTALDMCEVCTKAVHSVAL